MKTLLSCLCFFLLSKVMAQEEVNEKFQPKTTNVVVSAGSTVILNCTVDDNDNSSLQWSNPTQQTLYFGGKRALRDNRIQLVQATARELTLSISNVSLADEGEYMCSLFTMPVQTVKALVTVLGVPKRPIITGYTGPVPENGKLRLECQTSGSKPAAKLHWKKENQMLLAEPSTELEDPRDHTFTVTSWVEFNVSLSDNGASVTCFAEHPSTNSEVSTAVLKIEVLYSPHVTIEASSDVPKEGMKLHLNCVGQGNPEPKVTQWIKENGDLPQHTTQEGNVLTFTALNKSDAGIYVCEVSNSMGSKTTKFNLLVYDPSALPHSGIDHAVIGGVVAVIVFILLCLLIVLGRYLIRHKGTYLTHEAKGSDDAPDADTAIINAEGGQSSSDDKKEYFI